MDLYIYYRVAEAQAAALLPQVQAMQAALDACHGVQCALKRRPDSKDGLQTWMEVYGGCAPAFETELAQAVAAAGLAAHIDGARHTEVFVDIAPCA
ncbi:DUF4936 family protein [Pseudoduganella danionis]|uniref:DUF4936 family protein n=1 Tax=Pseudoduganella danionis TaxID=1890295 RepID=A0ABW9STX1_9BURK|nr:DUF4936 family protein [Pseudoduganella danionis]MTW34603.1 DUF4936 family protein [Pseudoduganella danionis]